MDDVSQSKLRARNLRTAAALALVALLFFVGTIAARELGPQIGLAAVGGGAFLFLVFAIGRHVRRDR